MPKTRYVAVGAGVIWTSFTAWILLGPDQEAVRAVDNVLFSCLSLANLILACLAARSAHGRIRAAWTLMAIGMAGWALGSALTPYYDITRELPPPSLADAAYLSFTPATCAALLLFPSRRVGPSRIRTLLDGVLVAGTFFLISWLTFLRPILASGELAGAELIVSLAYPLADVMLVTIGTIVLLRATPTLRPTLALLAIAVLCIAVADSAFVYVAEIGGEYIDMLNFAGMLFLSVGITAGSHVDSGDADSAVLALPGRSTLWLPYLPLLIATAVVVLEPRSILTEIPVLVTLAVLVVLALARQVFEATAGRRLLIDVADQGSRDPLTGLANRIRFEHRLAEAMRRHRDRGTPFALIALDLDDFKAVNDNLGHQAGDELLRSVAERVSGCVRSADTIARTGGDEFAVLVEGGGPYLVADRIRLAFQQPFAVAAGELIIRPSIGVAIADERAPYSSTEDLLANADTAMYTAKRSRSTGVHTYTPQDQLTERSEFPPTVATPADLTLLADLRRAIGTSELSLLYQPIVDLRTGRVTSVEALLRWTHPRRGVLKPDVFLPPAREHGLMSALSDFVLRSALDDAARWLYADTGPRVSVNVFAPLLDDASLADWIAQALADRGLPGSALTLEITEDRMVDDTAHSRRTLEHLRGMGVRIAIDDFGAGHSGLSYLRQLPVDEMKIDRGFITAISTDLRSATIVRSLIDLAHQLELTVVAEGVEDDETARILRDCGCDAAQGYLFSLPIALDRLLEILQAGGELRSYVP